MEAPGVGIGNQEQFTYQAPVFLDQIAGVADPLPPNATFADGPRSMKIIEAIVQSAQNGGAEVAVNRPRGLQQVCSDPATGGGTGFGRLSGRCAFAPSGDGDSGNPAFAISRGSPARRSRRLNTTAGFLACYFPLHLLDHGSAIRSRDISSRPRPLREQYNAAPRGAATTPTAHTDRLISTRLPAALPPPTGPIIRPLRRDRLGGLVHEYVHVA